jgi:hypothetical protein
MINFTRVRGFVFGSALLSVVSLSYTRPVQASSTFPPELQKALEKRFSGTAFCVPVCTACHTIMTGGATNLNPFGKNMLLNGLFSPETVDPALNKLLDAKLDSDGDGKTDNDELKMLDAPGGPGAFCSDLTYGCGARIASAPPPIDKVGLFSAGLVGLGLIFLRRGRRHRANH